MSLFVENFNEKERNAENCVEEWPRFENGLKIYNSTALEDVL